MRSFKLWGRGSEWPLLSTVGSQGRYSNYPFLPLTPRGKKEQSKCSEPNGGALKAREKALGIYLAGCPFLGDQVRK